LYENRLAWSVGAVLLLAGVAIAMHLHGLGGRAFARSRTTHVVEAPGQAPLIWEEQRVRGRTLLLFDDYPLALLESGSPAAGPPEPSNVVGYAVHQNLVRRIYLVVPDARWEEFQRRKAMYLPLREAPGIPGALYLFTFSGVPMIAVPAASLPPIKEPVLVYVNGSRFDLPQTLALLDRKRLSFDVLVALQGGGGG
jgi:hypothetical protein